MNVNNATANVKNLKFEFYKTNEKNNIKHSELICLQHLLMTVKCHVRYGISLKGSASVCSRCCDGILQSP